MLIQNCSFPNKFMLVLILVSILLTNLPPTGARAMRAQDQKPGGAVPDNAYTPGIVPFSLILRGADGVSNSTSTPAVLPDSFVKILPANGSTNQAPLTLIRGRSSNVTRYEYCYDIANDHASASWVTNATGISKVLNVLPSGFTYYRQVRTVNNSGTTYVNGRGTTFISFKTQPLPAAPVLISPVIRAITNSNFTDFSWMSVVSGNTYQIEISIASDFSTTFLSFVGAPGVLTYSAKNLPDGVYYWHVHAINSNSEAGRWSATRSFTKDTTPPAVPVLDKPLNLAAIAGTPSFVWWPSPTAVAYQFQSPVYESGELLVPNILPPTMAPGLYFWRVRAKDAAGNWSSWSSAYTITIQPPVPVAPHLTAPANAFLTSDNTPTLAWNGVDNGNTYQVEISKTTNFAVQVQSFASSGFLSYTAAVLPDGVYYWHTRAINTSSVAGAWSAYRSFTIDTTPPAAPVLNKPANSASVTNTPAFSWLTSATASNYQFQYDNAADFSSPVFTSGELTKLIITPPTMAPGLYYWRVRAKDAAGNWSAWSLVRTITKIH